MARHHISGKSERNLRTTPLVSPRRDVGQSDFGTYQPGGEHIVIGSLEGLAGQLLSIIS